MRDVPDDPDAPHESEPSQLALVDLGHGLDGAAAPRGAREQLPAYAPCACGVPVLRGVTSKGAGVAETFTVTLTGIEPLQRLLDGVARQAFEVLMRALEQQAEMILQASYPHVPIDTTLLQSTGEVEREDDTVTIRYGGHGAAPYAIVQHENTAYNHPNGGQHHYLSGPFHEALADLPAHVGASVRQMLQGARP